MHKPHEGTLWGVVVFTNQVGQMATGPDARLLEHSRFAHNVWGVVVDSIRNGSSMLMLSRT
jgi:hypothetical protein